MLLRRDSSRLIGLRLLTIREMCVEIPATELQPCDRKTRWGYLLLCLSTAY
jgi:hypothetical protein